jgi:hypothetical protein
LKVARASRTLADMKLRLTDLVLLALANVIGFFSVHFCYVIGVKTGMLPITDPNFNPGDLRYFFHVIITTWMVCAVFSLAFLFLKGTLRYLFLLAPAVIPMAYGFKVLLLGW